jgi:hypothetical protein
MATLETQKLDEIISSNRRKMLMLGGTALAGLAFAKVANAQATVTDAEVLTFALNLEYLEANFYTLAASGQTITTAGIGVGAGTSATGGGTITVKPSGAASCKVPFTSSVIAAYAAEVASEEQKHVTFLRTALGSSTVAAPNIDLYNSFNALAQYAGIGASFDPFASDVDFLLGSYIFEDVGVTAYHGAAGLLTTKSNLDAAAGILAVEGYHAGMIRTALYGEDPTGSNGYLAIATKISNARAKLDGTNNDDIGLGTAQVSLEAGSANYTASTFVDADSNTIAFARTTTQVLAIVYAGGAAGVGGGFFPNGLNGTIK